MKLAVGRTTVINGKVYCGGMTDSDARDHIIYCYDQSQDRWTTLPPLPVKWFGLGRINSTLVAIGGVKNSKNSSSNGSIKTNEVYTYDERSRKWKQTIPPMPTVRGFPSVLSLQSALIVAGGYKPPCSTYTNAVEIFKPGTSQWYTTDPLPTACRDISLVAIGNTCYALGGYEIQVSNLNQALYARVDSLLRNAIPANQPTQRGSSDTQSAWKTLPNTPTYHSSAGTLANSLLAIGGDKTSTGGAAAKEVYVYSPLANSWLYISDLLAPRSTTAVAILSSTKVLVIGGWVDGVRVNTVYMGTLTIR